MTVCRHRDLAVARAANWKSGLAAAFVLAALTVVVQQCLPVSAWLWLAMIVPLAVAGFFGTLFFVAGHPYGTLLSSDGRLAVIVILFLDLAVLWCLDSVLTGPHYVAWGIWIPYAIGVGGGVAWLNEPQTDGCD